MKPFSLLVKPASADCNLRCWYCFYLDRSKLYSRTRDHRMSDAVLHRMISSYYATPQETYTFGWQGGEPTMMGLDFYKRVTQLQQELGRPGLVVANGFQTNGTQLDDDWAKFFAQYNFLLGVSVDGPADLHDRPRRDIAGKGSHARVMEGIAALRRHNVEFNVLTLVNHSNVSHPERVYDYLCEQGFNYHQYIECVEFDLQGKQQFFAISGKEWGDFICRIFDRWYERDVFTVSVRLFDTILAQLVDGVYNTCQVGRSCDQYFVVEHNGDVYPCDFNVTSGLLVGNIMDGDWETMRKSPVYRRFALGKMQMHPKCAKCKWKRFINGDCPKNRPGGPQRQSHLCAGWRQFFEHTMPRFEELARHIRRSRAEAPPISNPFAAG